MQSYERSRGRAAFAPAHIPADGTVGLDVNTLFLVTIYVEAMLGLLLLFAWIQNSGYSRRRLVVQRGPSAARSSFSSSSLLLGGGFDLFLHSHQLAGQLLHCRFECGYFGPGGGEITV
jgi:hypothetical protein